MQLLDRNQAGRGTNPISCSSVVAATPIAVTRANAAAAASRVPTQRVTFLENDEAYPK